MHFTKFSPGNHGLDVASLSFTVGRWLCMLRRGGMLIVPVVCLAPAEGRSNGPFHGAAIRHASKKMIGGMLRLL